MAAKKPGKTVIKGKPGKPAVAFKPGGLHESLGVPKDQKIPPAKMAAAKAGKMGPKAQKQANLASGMLAAGRKTATRNAKKKG